MIPDKNKKEWIHLIKSNTYPDIKSTTLKMRINSVRQLYRYKQLTMDEAVADLYDFFVKHEKTYADDIQSLINSKTLA
ncbi:MAG: hypothetical protein JXB49_18840 [Bacteroidales bacterium]|nr:hypothetical protein [Bacteroidales bacterium]